MPVAYYRNPLGVAQITEEDGFITVISILDEDTVDSAVIDLPPESAVLKTAIQQLNEYFAGERKIFDLPIKQAGTDFQQQVWQQLLKIDYGKTISYSQNLT